MHLNTELHRQLGCPLSLHRIQINLAATLAEPSDFGNESLRNQFASLFTLN
jgi:hypothetical protein